MDLLARIVTLRLTDELREKLGATYGGGAKFEVCRASIPDRGTVFGRDELVIQRIWQPFESAVDGIIAETARCIPADADLFERARKPVLESYTDWRQAQRYLDRRCCR